MNSDTLHIMVDIETTGTRPGCRILSIGAVTFELDFSAQSKAFQVYLDPKDTRFSEDIETLRWWDKQDYLTKRINFTKGTEKVEQALPKFNAWVASVTNNRKGYRFWSKGSAFDFPILEYAYDLAKIQTPWGKENPALDLKTLLYICPHMNQLKNIGVPHDSLDDAIYEAKQAAAILRWAF